jgi:SAM-dependent methyltransferase
VSAEPEAKAVVTSGETTSASFGTLAFTGGHGVASPQLPPPPASGLAAESPAKPSVLEPPTAGKTVLHVGCGAPNPKKLHRRFREPGWREVRLDIDPAVKPDIVSSMTDMSVVPAGSVDAVWSSHNVEHLEAHQVPLALREFFRVLKPGSFVLITLPDLQAVAALVANDKLEDVVYVSPAGPIRPLDILFGHAALIARGNSFMAHRTGFTASTLSKALTRARFVRVATQRSQLDLWAVGFKPT